MGTRRALTRVLGRTRQLPAGDVLNGVYPPYTPVYKANGGLITVYRRDGVEQGVAAHIPAYQANGAELRVATDSSFAVVVTQAAGTTRLANAGVAGVTQKIPVQFANLAAFPAIGSPERLYIAANTRFEYVWSGNGYVLVTSLIDTPGTLTTDQVVEGSINLYFTAVRVLSTILAGLVTTTNSAITTADSLLVALGKLQAQLNDKLGLTANAVSATKLVTARSINTVPFDGTADIAISNVTTGLEAGYGSNNGSGNNWGANVWGIGSAYDGSGLGTAYTSAGQYGLSWLRSTHTEADAQVGEGVYVYQNGVLKGGVGSAGVKTAGSFYGDGSGITGLNAGNLSSGTIASARLSGTYSINVSGNAGTATVLQTARTINGVSFNGSANITIPTGGGVFSLSYVSALVAIAVNGYSVFSHGLGASPKLYYGRLVCVTAELGYVAGEELDISAVTRDRDVSSTGSSFGTYNYGYSVGSNSIELYVQFGGGTSQTADNLIYVPSKGSAVGFVAITGANWRVRLYAYA